MTSVLMSKSFVETEYFLALAHTAFEKADEDGDGKIDLTELVISLCRLHVMLNKGLGGVPLPKKSDVQAALSKCDLNRDGNLNIQEFAIFAQYWFKHHLSVFVPRLLFFGTIYALIVPTSAVLIRNKLPPKRKIPIKLLSFALTIGLKFLGSRKTWSM